MKGDINVFPYVTAHISNTKDTFETVKHSKRMIKVCAWCPKTGYPTLKKNQEYTHGICRKHYRLISKKKDLALGLLANEIVAATLVTIDSTSEKFRKQSLRYLRIIVSSVKFAK